MGNSPKYTVVTFYIGTNNSIKKLPSKNTILECNENIIFYTIISKDLGDMVPDFSRNT